MKIATLKDLKGALSKIPDKVLENFGAGIDEDGEFVSLLYWDGRDDHHDGWLRETERYKVLEDINDWIENIAKVQNQTELQEELGTEEPISSEDKIEIKLNDN